MEFFYCLYEAQLSLLMSSTEDNHRKDGNGGGDSINDDIYEFELQHST